jgi:hypothetical protein
VTERRQWAFEMQGRPLTVNKVYGEHWRTRHEIVQAARQEAKIVAIICGLGRAKPKPAAVSIEATPINPDGRWLADVGAIYPHVKAAIDGIVDSGAIPNDTPEYVRRITMHPPEVVPGRKVGLFILVLEEL